MSKIRTTLMLDKQDFQHYQEMLKSKDTSVSREIRKFIKNEVTKGGKN